MKRRFSAFLLLLLSALMLLSAAFPAAAAGAPEVMLSTQNLTVNGRAAECEKYNIDGSNYFKLRDLAMLLRDTASRFSVGWDAASGTVAIRAGEAYTPIGNELTRGADQSATAVASAQTITINGEAVRDLSVYNVGGNNYFKLRDLADRLGFTVDYDAATRTAQVRAAESGAAQVRSTLADGAWSVHLDGSFEEAPGGVLVGIRDAKTKGARRYTVQRDGKLYFSAATADESELAAWRERFAEYEEEYRGQYDPEEVRAYIESIAFDVVIENGVVTDISTDYVP